MARWIEPDPLLIPVVIAIFELFNELKNYKRVAKIINERYRQLIGFVMVERHIKRIISDPVYMGQAQHLGVTKEVKAIVTKDLFVISNAVAAEVKGYHKPHQELIPHDLAETPELVREGLNKREIGYMHFADGGHVAFDSTDRNYPCDIMECQTCDKKWRFSQSAVAKLKQLGRSSRIVKPIKEEQTTLSQIDHHSTKARRKMITNELKLKILTTLKTERRDRPDILADYEFSHLIDKTMLTDVKAIATLLYDCNTSLRSGAIAKVLTKSWEHKRMSNISRELTSKNRILWKYVVRDKVTGGYNLTNEGRRWYETEVLPTILKSTIG